MEKHTIGGLKKILVASSNFYDIADYFLIITETNMAALDGKIGKNKVLKEVIISTLTQICLTQGIVKEGDPIVLVNMMMIEVRERYFWHGSGLLNGKHIMSFLYFADLDKGLISISKGSNNFFARVTVKSLPQSGNPTEEFSDN